jgi:hypothetical protein
VSACPPIVRAQIDDAVVALSHLGPHPAFLLCHRYWVFIAFFCCGELRAEQASVLDCGIDRECTGAPSHSKDGDGHARHRFASERRSSDPVNTT